MTNEENKRRSVDPNVNYIKDSICDCTGDKSYVFISYKSDDWETVLQDIVYRLVKDYGLNVYFDGSFDSHNSLWINQFPENMGDYKCKGVIAFFDDKYATSYATLMELLYSQTKKAAMGKPDPNGLPIVPIDLAKLTNITGDQGQKDTGLGVNTYEDGSVNVNAASEMDLFSKSFIELVKRNVLDDAQYIWEPKEKLNAMTCSQIVRELKAFKRINENYYSQGMSLDGIVGSIRNACGTEVFSQKVIVDDKVKIRFVSGDRHWEETIKKGNYISRPDPGENVGYEFKGWISSVTGHEWDFNNPVEGNMEIVARWEKEISVDVCVLDENTTLEEFERICENTDICSKIGSFRKTHGNAQPIDYLMASLLGGCDNQLKAKNGNIVRKAANKYCIDAISFSPSNQYTWQSNARKFVKEEERLPGYFKENGKFTASGQLLDYDIIFRDLPRTITIGDVLEKFRKNEKGFITRDNDKIYEVWNFIKTIKLSEGKKGIDELL